MVVDMAALRDALERGPGGAAVDVFPSEPAKAPTCSTARCAGLDSVILTPHIGGSTQEAQANIGREVAEALVRYLDMGSTLGCVTLPQLDLPKPVAARQGPVCRIVNVHENVPGVLSAINRVVAESGVNIVGQALATMDDVGLLFMDVPLAIDDARTSALREAISVLETSVRTRLLRL
jgi:D-3-phosphoglycerate dehydrogenase